MRKNIESVSIGYGAAKVFSKPAEKKVEKVQELEEDKKPVVKRRRHKKAAKNG